MPRKVDYFAWYAYDLSSGGHYRATVRTGELRYHQGHQHGVQPSAAQEQSLMAELVAAVIQKAAALGIPYPGNAHLAVHASLRTRSQKG